MENNFAGINVCSLAKIEKSFSHKLTDYFIQGVRNNYPFIFILILYSSFCDCAWLSRYFHHANDLTD